MVLNNWAHSFFMNTNQVTITYSLTDSLYNPSNKCLSEDMKKYICGDL